MAAQWKYLPILKWKQGERIAVSKLTAAQWDPIVVLAELMAIDSAPDGASLRIALPPYLKKLGQELKTAIPKNKPVAVDTRYVSQGYAKQIRLLIAVFRTLHKESEREIIPVLRASTAVTESSDLALLLKEHNEIILRIDVNATDPTQILPIVKLLTDAGFSKQSIHLLLDQESLVNSDPAAQLIKVTPHVLTCVQIKPASVTVAGGAFPENLIGVKQGIVDFSRVEWHVWKSLKSNPALAGIRYGDYTVSNPSLPPPIDPKMVNPSVAIRYATDGFWRVFKAGGFKNGKPDQYKNLCGLLLLDVIYSTATFSYGDDCYDKAANAKLGNGNPSSWRRDATNHHLVYTASKL